jgi:hypothetical protein
MIDIEVIEKQIREKQKIVDYDIKEFPVEILVQKYLNGKETDENALYIPSYQREFVWKSDRQSKFIESVFLGLPIPYIFTAEMEDGRLEIVDGSQRIRTLADFISDKLILTNLDILTDLIGLKFSNFPISRQRKFNNTTIRMIVLSEKSDEDSRFMMFERINSGSEALNSMEKRRGISQGEFIGFLEKLAKHPLFIKNTRFTNYALLRREPEELILRFFAYSEKYLDYKGNVNDFLNDYTDEKNIYFDETSLREQFETMLNYVDKLPNGFVKDKSLNTTPRGRFEAISVGVHLALQLNPELKINNIEWLDSPEFENEVTGGSTNTIQKLRNRIDFVKSKLLSE